MAGWLQNNTHIEKQIWSGRNDRGLRPTVSREKNCTRKTQKKLTIRQATQEVSRRYRVSLNSLSLSIKGYRCRLYSDEVTSAVNDGALHIIKV